MYLPASDFAEAIWPGHRMTAQGCRRGGEPRSSRLWRRTGAQAGILAMTGVLIRTRVGAGGRGETWDGRARETQTFSPTATSRRPSRQSVGPTARRKTIARTAGYVLMAPVVLAGPPQRPPSRGGRLHRMDL